MTNRNPSHLHLDFSGLTHAGVGAAGVSEAEIAELAESAAAAVAQTRELHRNGTIGFPDLPDDTGLARDAMDFARHLPDEIDTMVVLGIGGSSLGPHALYSALARPFDSHRPRAPGMPRRLFFPDNADPVTFGHLLETLDLERTVFNVVTKSGGTAETAAQTLVVVDEIRRRFGDDGLRRHMVVTTDPNKSALGQVADRFKLRRFPVPSSVGGRFSVLSAVGLVPAAAAGLDVYGLLDGARSVRDWVFGEGADTVDSNPALQLASLLHLHDRVRGRPIVVMMPYADALYDCADWFRQLWAESLGKANDVNGNPVHVGPTPIASRGATDQHSQLQLYSEGPDDKVFLTVSSATREREITLPDAGIGDIDAYAYLVGKGMGQLLDAELSGTTRALLEGGRPTGKIVLDRLDSPSVGAFIMLLEAATAFAGPLYGVDPYDQPGVEEAKRLAFGALGRPGYPKPPGDEGPSDPRYVF